MENNQPPSEEHFLDRRRWLKVVGLIEILIGGICALCGLLFALLSSFFRQNPSTESLARGGMLAVNVLAFVAAAALFVCLGIGTIRARRWARDMMLVASWVWLIAGACAVVLVFATLPGRLLEISGPGQEPLGSSEIIAVMGIVGILTGFLYIVLPALFLLFYYGKNVRRTFETLDPSAPWTSKCPLSILTLCQFLACGALMSLGAVFYTDTVPVGSRTVTGVPARLIPVVFAAVYAYLTWAVYKLKNHAWWINLIFTILAYALFFGSYPASRMAELASSMGLSAGLSGRFPGQTGGKMLSEAFAVFGVGYVAFLLLVKKHFKSTHPESERGR